MRALGEVLVLDLVFGLPGVVAWVTLDIVLVAVLMAFRRSTRDPRA
jgi:hypothetical protein